MVKFTTADFKNNKFKDSSIINGSIYDSCLQHDASYASVFANKSEIIADSLGNFKMITNKEKIAFEIVTSNRFRLKTKKYKLKRNKIYFFTFILSCNKFVGFIQ